MGWITHIGVVVAAVRGPHVACVVLPGAGAQHVRRAVATEPGRAVGRRALIRLVPAILHPLVDPASHVVQAEWIGLEAADLDGLFGAGIAAILAGGHAMLDLVAPP